MPSAVSPTNNSKRSKRLSLRTLLAIGAGKFTAGVVSGLRLGSGTSLPGKVARKFDPDLLRYLGQQVTETTIAVTGTNGKTTTCGLLARFLEEGGKRVVHNQLGANMVPGITAAILRQSGLMGNLNAQCAVLEVDEASMKGVTQEMPADIVLVTNLFRDQLDRYGELDTTARLIQSGINSDCKTIVLNADDPLVYAMATTLAAGNILTFGIESVVYGDETAGEPTLFVTDQTVPFPREVTDCPQCGHPLRMQQFTLGHLGHYSCQGCGYQRPQPTLTAMRVVVKPTESIVDMLYQGETWSISLPLPGLFNVYNFLAAALVALEVGVGREVFERGLHHYGGVFGRAETLTLLGKSVMVMLIKNPVGATEVLKLVASDPKARLWVALNDGYADGRDVSWIWDASFDVLEGAAVGQKPIVVSGVRGEDMAIRLKYGGILPDRIELVSGLKESIHRALALMAPGETLYLLPTYTALLALRDILPQFQHR